MPVRARSLATLALFIMAMVMMAGCGVKPGNVEGKEGFPHSYPDVTTDPVPSGRGADHF